VTAAQERSSVLTPVDAEVGPSVQGEPDGTTLDRIAGLPDGEWRTCRKCRMWLHRERLDRGYGICPHCGHHHRLSARERIGLLVDTDSFEERNAGLRSADPLDFVDEIPYRDRLLRAQRTTGLSEAAVIGTATMAGARVVLAVLDFRFMGGSMGTVVGEKITRAAELAAELRVPLVTVSSSGGARMQEAILSLLQMARTAAAVVQLRQAGVPFISVLTDPVYGGVAASFAALGDVVVAETGTRAGFAGPKVIEQTIREKLPADLQTAGFLHEHGHIDLVIGRMLLAERLGELVLLFTAAIGRGMRPEWAVRPAGRRDGSAAAGRDAWETVQLARKPGRPTAGVYLRLIFSGFVELHGDRVSEDDKAVIGGLGWLGDMPVMVLAHAKGADTAENIRRNFGMPHPSGYAKARRLLVLAERLGIPVVTLVDTPGAHPGVRAEETNQSGAIAETIAQALSLRVPIVCVVTGEGGSGGALALATGDRLLMQENAVYSVISPEGCATILFGDATRAPEAARALRPRAIDLFQLGVVDEIIAEPIGGAHVDAVQAAAAVTEALRAHLVELTALDTGELLRRRRRRIRGYGAAAAPDTATTADGPHAMPGKGENHD
jgi:acetyl-CoA carboxylase carboxyl transferase subunit beta